MEQATIHDDLLQLTPVRQSAIELLLASRNDRQTGDRKTASRPDSAGSEKPLPLQGLERDCGTLAMAEMSTGGGTRTRTRFTLTGF